jgi:hypothetical protein
MLLLPALVLPTRVLQKMEEEESTLFSLLVRLDRSLTNKALVNKTAVVGGLSITYLVSCAYPNCRYVLLHYLHQ